MEGTIQVEARNGLLRNSSSSEDKSTKTTTRNCCCCQLAWRKWVKFCQSINKSLQRFFTKFALKIATHPAIVLFLGVLIPLLLTAGMLRYRLIERSEDLYLPQNSQGMVDLKRSEKYFPTRMKLEEFIIKHKFDPWILRDEIFEIALTIHQRVFALPGFTDVCVKDNAGVCLVSSPLEIIGYNKTSIRNVSNVLAKEYKNPSRVLQNGRLPFMSYSGYFAYFKVDHTGIRNAEALRNVYMVQDPINSDIYKKLITFESEYISIMESMIKELEAKDLVLLYNCARSIDMSLSDSASKDIKLVPVSLFFMVLFCAFVLTRFKNKVIGHFMLSLGGIFALFLGIGSAFGFLMLVGAPYIAFAGVLPFLVLGVGIDNMFIIIDAVDRQDPKLVGPRRIAKAVGEVGASITMTTLTDLVAFLVSMVTDFPAIRYFCMYASVSITFCYFLVITIFLSFLTYDVRRIERRRKDIIPCVVDATVPEVVWEDGKATISSKVMESYSTMLMKKPCQYVILVCSLLLVGFGVWGAANIDQSFNQLVLGLKGSAYVKYFSYFNQAYPAGYPVSLIIDTPVNYADPKIQNQIRDLDQIARDNNYMEDVSINWMTSFMKWSQAEAKGNTAAAKSFSSSLKKFLSVNRQFYTDLKFSNDSKTIVASRIVMFTKDNSHSIFRRDAMVTLRKDLKEKSRLPVYAIAYIYILIEQFVVILPDTIRNLSICACAILVITLPYLVNPKVTFFVFFGFVCLMFELLGMMYLWQVSLNGISMIIIVMAIGFAVDYSAHIAHAFIVSNEKMPEKRVIYALKTMGSSVSMGGLSTFIGIIVTAFASSELFKIFFKMVFGIVVLGLIHGLLFLPIHLSVFCRGGVSFNSSKNKTENDENEIEVSRLITPHPETAIGEHSVA